jgi:hypothetical protein
MGATSQFDHSSMAVLAVPRVLVMKILPAPSTALAPSMKTKPSPLIW